MVVMRIFHSITDGDLRQLMDFIPHRDATLPECAKIGFISVFLTIDLALSWSNT
jgi:hypothetical protein